MASVGNVLFHHPWIAYNRQLTQSRLTLTYPENVIFVGQLLDEIERLDVYQTHPYAQKPDATPLQQVDWSKALIVLDRELQIVMAPDAVRELVQLDRRLAFQEARDTIFGPFRFWPWVEVFQRPWIGIVVAIVCYLLSALGSTVRTGDSVALTSKSLTLEEDPDP